MNKEQAYKDIQDKDDMREELARIVKNQEFEIEKLRRIHVNKDDENESERRRFIAKWERKCEEQDKERNEWSEMYQGMQREIIGLKQQMSDGNQFQMTMKQRTLGDNDFANLSFKGSPGGVTSDRGKNVNTEFIFNSRGDN